MARTCPIDRILPVLLLLAALPAQAFKCPNLQLVIDRSGSMNQPLTGDKTRWQVALAAIKSIVEVYGGKLPIGLSLFPYGGECGAATLLPPSLKSSTEIVRILSAQRPSGLTPIATAMREVAMVKELRDPDRKQYVVLVTDGLPECDLHSGETVETAVETIAAARRMSPPITTFVVGFGGDFVPSGAAALGRMAEAGGRPAPTEEKFYRADNADQLARVLATILSIVNDEFGERPCDESCNTLGCPDGGVCVKLECQANPCAGMTCGKDLFCFTDGTSPGTCRKTCTHRCPEGTRCSMGSCIADPCGNVCLPGTICNATARRCEIDRQCGGEQGAACEAPYACRLGRCVLDPCLFISCPSGSVCIAWDGSCTSTAEPPEDTRRGCAALPGGTRAGAMIMLLLGLSLCVRGVGRRRLLRSAMRGA